MPEKIWTTAADFNEGTHVGTEVVDDKLMLAPGYTDGYWRSQAYEAAEWDHWSTLNMEATRPIGTVVVYRFRSGETSAACLAADWSEYYDGFATDGTLHHSLAAWFLNNSTASKGKFIQVEIRMLKE